jgi:hypothetical protein
MGIVLIDFVRKLVEVMYPYYRVLELSLFNSILSKPFAIYCKSEIPAKGAFPLHRSQIQQQVVPHTFRKLGEAGFQGTAVPCRGGEKNQSSRVPRDSRPLTGCGVSPQILFFLGWGEEET